MRIVWAVAACLALAGCDQAPSKPADTPGDATSLAPPDAKYDYRYAFRLPGGRIAGVQESNQRGCEQLGPTRCRVTALRYKVDDHNNVAAILTVRIDPLLARAFGKAASDVVTGARGTLTDAEAASTDAAARSGSVVARLRGALADAQAQRRDGALTPEQRTDLNARAARMQAAIAAIGEVDQGEGDSLATTPMLLTYSSGGALTGGPGATFSDAGDSFMTSLAGLANVLAGIGPWVILLLGGALILRRIVQSGEPRAEAPALPPAPHEVPEHERRGVIQRWFARDEPHRDPEPEHVG